MARESGRGDLVTDISTEKAGVLVVENKILCSRRGGVLGAFAEVLYFCPVMVGLKQVRKRPTIGRGRRVLLPEPWILTSDRDRVLFRMDYEARRVSFFT